MDEDKPQFIAQEGIMDRAIVPEPVYDENPDLIELYYGAWQSAYTHIFTCKGAPVETYMNEGIRINRIWIWDTCFMVMFCRYAAKHFPGIQSLDNFYRVIHDGESMVLKVHHADNPPLFAWTEMEYLKHTGNLERIRHILLEKQYLQKHFDFINSLIPDQPLEYAQSAVKAQYVPGKGYRWAGCPSGMDNTPRGRDDYQSIYWVDLAAQQGLSALYISRLAEIIGETELAAVWQKKYEAVKTLVNSRFWSETDQMYFDRYIDENLGFCKVLTPASTWPLLAEMCSPEQAAALAEVYADPDKLGCGPVASVAADDPAFDECGGYWRGGVWMPVVYMSVKALEKNGYPALADFISEQMVTKILRTYCDFAPPTYWECYNPIDNMPSTNKSGKFSRPDFCGWTALGPISLFIENLLCVRDVNALTKTIRWEPRSAKRNGIRNLMLGEAKVSLIADPEHRIATVESETEFTLQLNGKTYAVQPGKQEFTLD